MIKFFNHQDLYTILIRVQFDFHKPQQKDNKIARARWASAICGLRKVYKTLLHQIAREIMSLLVNNLNEKRITVSQDGRNLAVRVLFVICTQRCYMKNTFVFSHSNARNFFTYIIKCVDRRR